MKFRGYEDDRQWLLDALQGLGDFARSDADFRGDRQYHGKSIRYQHRIVEDGKYRVVFLGAFNVGKSTAINAFLGGGFLPMDVEECTSKLTFIQRGEALKLLIRLGEAASEEELGALGSLYRDIPANIEASEDARELGVTCEESHPEAMRRCLEPLITVLADEAFPHLAPLREKIDELHLELPTSVLEEDIVIVDTPGVHSVSETRQEITYGIIEHSHLVLDLVDSGFAGNIHDLNFIKRIITCRGRRVFFVLNKADKLDTDEIDTRLSRGPAWSLLQAFKRHGIPEDSEVFFLSGYRALKAQQLTQGHITLDELLADNRISLPTSVVERLKDSEDPVRDLSGYLTGQSRLPHLRERLLDYLLNENKAGALLDTAARFAWERADAFLGSLENELRLAKNPAMFDELRANREKLIQKLEKIRGDAKNVLDRYVARWQGGAHEGVSFKGYMEEFKEAISEASVNKYVIEPILEWLRTGDNLKEARQSKFSTLSAQTEHEVDTFVSTVLNTLNETIETNERETGDAITRQLGEVRGLRMRMTEMGGFDAVIELDTSMAASYAAFGAGGGAFGAVAGLVAGSVVPGLGTAIGAGIGGLLGAVGGFLTRLAWSEDRWIRKIEPSIRENVMNMLLKGGKDREGNPVPAVMQRVSEYLSERGGAFREAAQEEVDQAIAAVQRECDDLLAREEDIRREREIIITRLQPKIDLLQGIRSRAQELVRKVTIGDTQVR